MQGHLDFGLSQPGYTPAVKWGGGFLFIFFVFFSIFCWFLFSGDVCFLVFLVLKLKGLEFSLIGDLSVLFLFF